ncbi:hypothetical protein PDJAM_G00112220 [Pangasius djambal]|uniref:Uncharacterized protein n=1 Tax=Pangasius djambal TaxID=1691987 RepID=A0ACC5Y2G2_9TELE|nr:hypothetical protein [Pangasius djambal]
MIFAGLITHTLKQKPALSGKMHSDGEEQQKPILQQRGNKSLLDRMKEDKDMFRHRIESLPGNRPNMIKANRDSADLKDAETRTHQDISVEMNGKN